MSSVFTIFFYYFAVFFLHFHVVFSEIFVPVMNAQTGQEIHGKDEHHRRFGIHVDEYISQMKDTKIKAEGNYKKILEAVQGHQGGEKFVDDQVRRNYAFYLPENHRVSRNSTDRQWSRICQCNSGKTRNAMARLQTDSRKTTSQSVTRFGGKMQPRRGGHNVR
jgi:hypothetical protein